MKNRHNNIALTILIMLSIGTLGFMWNIQGPAVPFIKKSLGVDYAAIGLLLAVGSFGYLGGTLLGGLLVDKFGHKATLMAAFVLSGLSAVCMIYGNKFWLVALLFFVLQIGFGFFEASCNGIAAIIFTRNTVVMFSLLHMAFGMGAMGGTQFAGRLLSDGVSWSKVYLLSAVISVIMIIYLSLVRIPKAQHATSGGIKKLGSLLKDKRLLAWCVVLGGALLLEIGIANWLPNYFQEIYNMTADKAATRLTLFFACFTVGRLVSGFAAQKIGLTKFIWISMLIALAAIAVGLFTGNVGIYLIVISGLFSAGLFPTVMVVLTNEYTSHMGKIFGISIAVAGILSMLSNYIIGFVSNVIGLQMGIMTIPIIVFACTVIAFMLSKKKNIKAIQ